MNLSVKQIVALLSRQPFSTGCGIVAVVAMAAAIYLWSDVRDLEGERGDREKQGEAALTMMVSGPPLRQELASVREATLRIENNLVVEDNLAENLWYFYKREDQTKVRLVDIHQLNSNAPETGAMYRKIPYSLTVSGSFAHVTYFLRSLETGPHLANFTYFNFKRQDPRGSDVVLELNLELLGKK